MFGAGIKHGLLYMLSTGSTTEPHSHLLDFNIGNSLSQEINKEDC